MQKWQNKEHHSNDQQWLQQQPGRVGIRSGGPSDQASGSQGSTGAAWAMAWSALTAKLRSPVASANDGGNRRRGGLQRLVRLVGGEVARSRRQAGRGSHAKGGHWRHRRDDRQAKAAACSGHSWRVRLE